MDSSNQRKSQRGHQGNKVTLAGMSAGNGTVCSGAYPFLTLSQRKCLPGPKVRARGSAVQLAAPHSRGPGDRCQQEGWSFLGMFFLEADFPISLRQESLLHLGLRAAAGSPHPSQWSSPDMLHPRIFYKVFISDSQP